MSLENWKNGLYVYGWIPNKDHALKFVYEKLKHDKLIDYPTLEEFEKNIVVHGVEPLSNRDILDRMYNILVSEFNLECDKETFKGVYDLVIDKHPMFYIQEEIVNIDHEGVHWRCGDETDTLGELTTEPKRSPYFNRLSIDKTKKKRWWERILGI